MRVLLFLFIFLLPPSLFAGTTGTIVPGESMGTIRLGMTALEIRRTLSSTEGGCEVYGWFKDGGAIRLRTNCGGALRTKGGTQVAMDFWSALNEFGPPDSMRIQEKTPYDIRWFSYDVGIAFRVVMASNGMMITGIEVFKP